MAIEGTPWGPPASPRFCPRQRQDRVVGLQVSVFDDSTVSTGKMGKRGELQLRFGDLNVGIVAAAQASAPPADTDATEGPPSRARQPPPSTSPAISLSGRSMR